MGVCGGGAPIGIPEQKDPGQKGGGLFKTGLRQQRRRLGQLALEVEHGAEVIPTRILDAEAGRGAIQVEEDGCRPPLSVRSRTLSWNRACTSLPKVLGISVGYETRKSAWVSAGV